MIFLALILPRCIFSGIMHFTIFDWSAIVAYLGITLALGLYFRSRSGKSVDDYFVSGRNVSWWLAGTSMVATTFAADMQHADSILIMGSNMAECHPVAFRWVMESFRRPGWDVVADLAAGTRQPMFRWTRFAGVVVVVCDATAKSIATARRLEKVGTHLVVNRAAGQADIDRVISAVTLPLLGVVPDDPAVGEADRAGHALIDAAPASPAVRSIRQIATRLVEGLG